MERYIVQDKKSVNIWVWRLKLIEQVDIPEEENNKTFCDGRLHIYTAVKIILHFKTLTLEKYTTLILSISLIIFSDTITFYLENRKESL